MCPLRITAPGQPVLPFADMAVPESIVWLALPDEARSRAAMLLAGLVARQALSDLSGGGDDPAADPPAQDPRVLGQRPGGCR